ncbi:hypothetical protein C8R45DRAFT_1099919 [Mycena sanguinolenta]|nr:hypothetical protein C8R45DRAFT_1099919 [Mycena sanguinolenta]
MSAPRRSAKRKPSPGPPIVTLGLKECSPISVLSSDDPNTRYFGQPLRSLAHQYFDTSVDWDEATLQQLLRDAAPFILLYSTHYPKPCEEAEIFFNTIALYCDHYFHIFPSLLEATAPSSGGPALLFSTYLTLLLVSDALSKLISSRQTCRLQSYFEADYHLPTVIPAPAAALPPPVLSPVETVHAEFRFKLASDQPPAAPSSSAPKFKMPVIPTASLSTAALIDKTKEPPAKHPHTESGCPQPHGTFRGASGKSKSAAPDPSSALPVDLPKMVQTRSSTTGQLLVPDALYFTPRRSQRQSQSSQVESLPDLPSSLLMKPAKLKKKIVVTR